jgi:hypothetical protein
VSSKTNRHSKAEPEFADGDELVPRESALSGRGIALGIGVVQIIGLRSMHIGLRLGLGIVLGLFAISCVSPGGSPPKEFRVSADGVNSAEPAVAQLEDGNVAVVWAEHGDSGTRVLMRKFGKDGATAGDVVRVDSKDAAKTWHGDPPTIEIAPDGTIYVGWTASIPNAQGTTLYVSASRDGGKLFEAPVKVNDDNTSASHGMHSLAVDENGRLYVAWLDERYLGEMHEPEMHHDEMVKTEPNAELYFATSTDGGRTFSANKMIARDACPCCKTSIVAPDKSGRMFIGWRQVLPGSFRHISVIGSADGGQTFAQPIVVADDKWKIDACPVSGPSLDVTADGLEVAWYAGGDAGPHGIYWTHTSDLNDLQFSEPLLVAEARATGTPMLHDNRVLWTDSGKLRTAMIAGGKVNGITDIGPGSVPEFVENGGSVFTASIRDDGDKKTSVWLRVVPMSK